MYEELTKRLKTAAQWVDMGLLIPPSLCLEAADAIEVLSKTEKTTRWIPVTERLPNEYGEYLVLWRPRWKGIVPNWKYYYEIAEYEPSDGWISDIPQSAPMGGYEVCYWMDLPPEPRKEKQCL